MKIRIGSTWLAPGGFESTQGLRVNGQQITQEVEFFRATERKFYPRGNRTNSISFAVTRSFGSQREADAFLFTHFNNLPNSGDVYIYCGSDSDQQIITLPNAVLEAVSDASEIGTSVQVSYSIRGGIFRTDITPGPDPDMSNIRRAEVALSASDLSKDVTFSSPMPGVPVVAVNVSVPDSGDNIFATLKQSAINASGFSVYFSGPIPGAGYYLSYIAIS